MADDLIQFLLNKKCLRLGKTTLYWRNNSLVSRPSECKKTSGKKWKKTEARKKANESFHANRVMQDYVLQQLGDLVAWDIETQRNYPGKTSGNVFYSKNHWCISFRESPRVSDFAHFKLTVGPLAPGNDMAVRREGSNVTITWKFTGSPTGVGARDLLHVGFFRDSMPDGLFVRRDIAQRDKNSVTITLDGVPDDEVVHLYPFFGRQDKSDFSESDYFRC